MAFGRSSETQREGIRGGRSAWRFGGVSRAMPSRPARVPNKAASPVTGEPNLAHPPMGTATTSPVTLTKGHRIALSIFPEVPVIVPHPIHVQVGAIAMTELDRLPAPRLCSPQEKRLGGVFVSGVELVEQSVEGRIEATTGTCEGGGGLRVVGCLSHRQDGPRRADARCEGWRSVVTDTIQKPKGQAVVVIGVDASVVTDAIQKPKGRRPATARNFVQSSSDSIW